MRAIVIATGHLAPLDERHPAPMLPLVDRPFIQHVVESLVDQGVTEFDFVLHHLPEQVERLLGDGTRWGSRFRFHLARNPTHPYPLLRAWGLKGADEPVLLVHADRLPDAQLAQTRPADQTTSPVPFCWRAPSAGACAGGELRWTGWAWVSSPFVVHLPDDLDEGGLETRLLSIARDSGSLVEVSAPMSVRSYDALLAAHRSVLAGEFSGLMLTGRERDKGVWLSRNVSLHPAARLTPPVYIGENCRIGAGARLGPNASIGRDCVLDAHCRIEDSVIFPGSYVGEALDLIGVVVDKGRLINTRVGTAVAVADDFVLGSLSDRHIRERLGRVISQVCAATMLAFAWPVFLAVVIYLKLTRSGPALYGKQVVSLPAPPDEAKWRRFRLWSFCPDPAPEGQGEAGGAGSLLRDLFLRLLPALANIARGDLNFVGVTPRTGEEVKALPHDWKTLYLRAKAGVVTEAFVHYGTAPTEDELYSAEVFYSVTAGVRRDMRLLIGYLGRVLSIFSRRAEAGRVRRAISNLSARQLPWALKTRSVN